MVSDILCVTIDSKSTLIFLEAANLENRRANELIFGFSSTIASKNVWFGTSVIFAT